jgi:exosortase/archaeosortase family protein
MTLLRQLSPLRVFFALVGELFLLRYGAHQALGAGVLGLGIHGTDIYLPLFVGLGAGFLLLQRRAPIPIGIQTLPLALNLTLLTLTLLTLGSFDFLSALLGVDGAILLVLLGAASSLFSAVFVAVPFWAVLQRVREHKGRVFYALLAAQLLLVYSHVLGWAWKPLALATGKTSYHLLNAVGIWVQKPLVHNSLRLWNPSFAAYINMGCSGLEGIFFFLAGFVLFNVYDSRPRKVLEALWLVTTGCLFMFVLNVLRITVFFAGAVQMEKHMASERGREIFEWAFHANAGWVLYLAGMAWFFSRWVIRPDEGASSSSAFSGTAVPAERAPA